MWNSFKKSIQYTQALKLDLKEILNDKFAEYCDSICFLATGSFGKCQMTSGSDIDLICILDNSITDKSMLQGIIQKELTKMEYKHEFEFYPIETLEVWKWIAQYSTLYCSDLFYAVPLAGDVTLYQNLMDWIRLRNFEYLNCQSYFMYNLLYRDLQLQNPKSEKSLKYQKGGLRDFQFIKWISRRLYNNQKYLPVEYLLPLCQDYFLGDDEYRMLVAYAESILGYKWDIEEGKKELSECGKAYENLRENVAEIVERIKRVTFMKLFSGNRYERHYEPKDSNNRLRIFSQLGNVDSECMVLWDIWRMDNAIKLENALQDYGEWWSVRAAIALNPHCKSDLLSKLRKLKYPDMNDIVDFIGSNPNYEGREQERMEVK